MTTIEKGMYTVAQPEDLKVIEVIISGFENWDGYFGKMCKLKLGLKYKEFTTLKQDLISFHEVTQCSLGKFSINELSSLKRSLIILRIHIYNSNPLSPRLLLNFLDESINSLDSWVNEVINAIVCEIR